MKVLLIYATYSSGTELASQLVEDVLLEHNLSVVRKQVKDTAVDEFNEHDVIVLASPSWFNRKNDGMPHEFFLTFMDRAEGKKFPGKPFAVFGLGDSSYTKFCGAVDHLVEFVGKLEGNLITDPLRIDGFFFEPTENQSKLHGWAGGLAKLVQSNSSQ